MFFDKILSALNMDNWQREKDTCLNQNDNPPIIHPEFIEFHRESYNTDNEGQKQEGLHNISRQITQDNDAKTKHLSTSEPKSEGLTCTEQIAPTNKPQNNNEPNEENHSEKYISEQLQSIINQTYKDFHLYICDDVSTDSTSNILSEYKLQYNNTISILKNETNKGAKYNFSNLFQNSQADYVMFSDHDDVWLNNKIEVTYNKMIELENTYSKDTPILVFTDKFVTDDKLNINYCKISQ